MTDDITVCPNKCDSQSVQTGIEWEASEAVVHLACESCGTSWTAVYDPLERRDISGAVEPND